MFYLLKLIVLSSLKNQSYEKMLNINRKKIGMTKLNKIGFV